MSHARRMLLLVPLLIVLTPARAEDVACESVASIGVATMTEDGVITLRLRSLPPGPIAEGVLRYAPDNPQYDEIKEHLGGIRPGEVKPVRPWCPAKPPPRR